MNKNKLFEVVLIVFICLLFALEALLIINYIQSNFIKEYIMFQFFKASGLGFTLWYFYNNYNLVSIHETNTADWPKTKNLYKFGLIVFGLLILISFSWLLMLFMS